MSPVGAELATGIAPSLALGLNSPTRVFLNYLHVTQDELDHWIDELYAAFEGVMQ